MYIRDINLKTDFEMIQQWSESHGLGPVDKTRLSNYGYLAFDKEPVAVCFFYPFNGSKWCMFENIITNPNTNKEQRELALESVLNHVFKTAKDMGYKEIFTTSHLPIMNDRFSKMGFVMNDFKVNHFFGRLV